MEDEWLDAVGGEDGLRRLVDAFYDHMDANPEAAGVRAMHPADLGESRRKLWMFLVGRFGGRNLYLEERGHPRLRARHMPFPIGDDEAVQWLACMDAALAVHVADARVRQELAAFFAAVAAMMRNR